MEFDKTLMICSGSRCQRPNSRTPGESIHHRRAGSDTGVRRSWCADRARVVRDIVGQDLFLQPQQRVRRLDLPTPDCPAKMLMRPVNPLPAVLAHPEYGWKPSIRDNDIAVDIHLLVDELHTFVVQRSILLSTIIGSICKVSQATRNGR